MKLKWWDDAWKCYIGYLEKDKKILKKINNLLKDIDRNGYNCVGHQEPLKGDLTGWHSVAIDEKNRIVFKIDKDEIEIMQCGTHYKDK